MKTLDVKRIKILIGFIMVFESLSAQLVDNPIAEKKMCDGLMSATYIFEGKVDSGKHITVKTGEYSYANYMAYSIEVDKIIKGSLQKGKVEILQRDNGIVYKGPDGIISGPNSSEGIAYPPTQGVYFCFDTSGTGKASHFANSNSKTLQFYDGIPVTNDKIQKDPRGGIGLYFSTLSDFYSYISANYGVKIEDK